MNGLLPNTSNVPRFLFGLTFCAGNVETVKGGFCDILVPWFAIGRVEPLKFEKGPLAAPEALPD